MREKRVALPFGVRVTALAARQHGVVTRRQLNGLGLGDAAIGRLGVAGWLHRVHRGVYAVGAPTLTSHGVFMAAVLACGEGAVLSHKSAAVLWGLRRQRGPRIDVTVPTAGGRRARKLVVVHRSVLDDEEVTTRHSIPVTTPARTIADLAAVVPQREVERAMDEAAYLGLDLDGIRSQQGRAGGALVARVLADHEAGSTLTRSHFEERMLALCRRQLIPRPRVNCAVEGYTADFAWPRARVIVETDGWQAHGTRSAFERDRRRDADLTAAGWRVLRVTWRRLMREPDAVAAQLTRLLAA